MSIGDRFCWLLVTSCGLGLAPVASGTFGTLGGVVLAVGLQCFVHDKTLAFALLGLAAVLLAFGCAMGPFSKRMFKLEDPSQFVLDEVVGYLLTIAVYALLRGEPSPTIHACAFVAFRAFDVWKPPPARRMEELPGGLGIMMDDVFAGLYAGALVCLLPFVGIR